MNSKHFIAMMVVVATASGSTLAEEKAKRTLRPGRLGSTYKIHAFGDILLAGQPTLNDLNAAKAAGIKTVINLRLPQEMRFDEAAAVRDLGMAYHNFPISGPETLTDKVFEDIRKLLNDKKKRGVLVHCASANRVGAVWLPYRVLDGGMSYEKALAEARQIGLRTPQYEPKAAAYIKKKQECAARKQSQSATVYPVREKQFDHVVLRSDTPVLVDFYASWCSPCHEVAPILERLAAEFSCEVKFVKVNVDEEYTLANKYGVVGLPTMVLFRDGNIVDRIEGAHTAGAIRSRIDNATAMVDEPKGGSHWNAFKRLFR